MGLLVFSPATGSATKLLDEQIVHLVPQFFQLLRLDVDIMVHRHSDIGMPRDALD